MKATKLFIFCVLLLAGLTTCDDEKALPETTLEDSFVRFSFKVNQNNEVLEFPEQSATALEVGAYTFQKRDTLRIPVIASSRNELDEELIVNFESLFSSDFIQNNIEVFPQDGQLQFSKTVPTDTIKIFPITRFESLNQEQITFNLTSVSNPEFNIGYDREFLPLDQFVLNIGSTVPVKYNLENKIFSLTGEAGESISFNIIFDQLVRQSEIEGLEFLSTEFVQFPCDEGLGADFEFDLSPSTIESSAKTLGFTLTLTEDAPGFGTTLNINLNQVNDSDFEREGNTLITATTPEEPVMRSGDPASNWYNANNIFHRTYGKAWYFDETDQECDWQDYAAFTRPVDVDPGSEFDNGQGYHKYKIGFRNIISNPNGNIIGTNPFNFRRFYNGATVLSPAYNQMESIEFFPENGNNPTQGSVKVVSQTLVFIVEENDVETQINIPICGSGTYEYNAAEDRWEMFVTIIADETEVNGNNNAVKNLFIYTENNVSDPPDLNVNCPSYIEF
jgi:hypothetical protein